MTLQPTTTDSRPVVLYDAACAFCRWSLTKLIAWDRAGRLRPLALQDPEALHLLGDMSERRRMESWHLILADGRVHSGGAAAAPLLGLLPGGRPLAAVAAAFPRATDAAYDLIARHRSRLGRLLRARRAG